MLKMCTQAEIWRLLKAFFEAPNASPPIIVMWWKKTTNIAKIGDLNQATKF